VSLPAETIHRPWTADPAIPPEIYPAPIIDHAAARQRALQAFQVMKRIG
jgi:deoxyribodipyrimidine photo-lyase